MNERRIKRSVHNMTFRGKDEDGWMNWDCLICGRKLKMRFDPYEKIVVVPGNENAPHGGGTLGFRMAIDSVTRALSESDRSFLGNSGIKWDEAQ